MNLYNKKNLESGSDEVEELLREAEDAMLLKLNVNSHMAHLSSNLPPDLDHRFKGLKSGPSTNKPEKSTPKVASSDSTKVIDQSPVSSGNDEDNLFARFAALKASLPKPSSAASSSSIDPTKLANTNQISKLSSSSGNAAVEDSSHVDEDEVEKIVKWAIDAARLDPSPPSDDDNDDDDVSESDSSDEEDDKLQKGKRRPGK